MTIHNVVFSILIIACFTLSNLVAEDCGNLIQDEDFIPFYAIIEKEMVEDCDDGLGEAPNVIGMNPNKDILRRLRHCTLDFLLIIGNIPSKYTFKAKVC